MADDERNSIEQMLDEGLATYAAVEPRPGLEQRILHTVRSTRARPNRLWNLVFAASALVAFALMLWIKDSAPISTLPPRPVAIAREPKLPIEFHPPVLALAHPVKKRFSKKPPLPRLAQFPTPTPLTNEERALMGLVARRPKLAAETFADWNKRSSEPIEIQAISITPLDTMAQK